MLLTTYRRNGTPVATPVSVTVEGDHAFTRTYASAGKMKCLHRNPIVEVAPSTFQGTATGAAMRARAGVLDPESSRHAARLLARKYPFLQGIVVPLYHRLRGFKTVHLELTPLPDHTESS